MTTETIVVSGGAGFIGSHLSDTFIAAGHRVIVIDDLSSGLREQVHPAAELHVLDVRSAEAARVIEQSAATVLCHQAAQIDVRASVADPRRDAEINILGLLNLVEAGRRGRLSRVVFASSGGTVYGEQLRFPADEDHPTRPISPYGVSKLACEHYLGYYQATHGIDVTCLRYANVYGPRQQAHGEAGVVAIFLGRLLRDEAPLVYGDGEQTRDYVYVGDVAAANLRALTARGFGVFNVGTGLETSVNALLEGLRAIVGGPPGRPAEARAGEQRRSAITAARLERALGWRPQTALAEGLRATAAWFRQ
ncbi:MAG: NAD-dependent epimerase/dehydratase family protein [Proteobacteria bacterium]|nr:NAD-dependent epimerase/dehydratase family protein [Pseudomonadota bacterium]